MSKKKISIVAVDENYGIGKNGKLPWHLKKEINYFKERTLHTNDPSKINAVIMGRTTWESIPEKFRPLPDRKNIVLSTRSDYSLPDALVFNSIDEAVDYLENDSETENIFFIGGAQIFEQSLPYVDEIYLTQIRENFDCDTFFPDIPEYFEEAHLLGRDSENDIEFDYLLYQNKDND